MSAKIEVVLERMSDIMLDKSTRMGILVPVRSHTVTFFREEADMVTLVADNDSPLDLF
jgi:hypothetical protein